MPTKADSIHLQESLKFICMQKNQLHHSFLQRYLTLLILDTLGIPGYGNQNGWYLFAENFDVIKFTCHFFLEILLRSYKPVILSNLGMPGQTHQKQ